MLDERRTTYTSRVGSGGGGGGGDATAAEVLAAVAVGAVAVEDGGAVNSRTGASAGEARHARSRAGTAGALASSAWLTILRKSCRTSER